MIKVVLSNRAQRDLRKLDEAAQRRIVEKLQEYAVDPVKYARKLMNPKIGAYRFRIGDYRVIFDLEGEDLVILRLGARKDVYR